MSKAILINTDKKNVFGVFETMELAEKAANKCPDNTVLINEESDLNFTGPVLVAIYNSLAETPISKFRNIKTARERTWKAIDGLPVGIANKVMKPKAATSTSKRSRMAGKKFKLLPGWREKKFHFESRRETCFTILVHLTKRGKRQGLVDEYVQLAEKENIIKTDAMVCLSQLMDKSQKLTTVELV